MVEITEEPDEEILEEVDSDDLEQEGFPCKGHFFLVAALSELVLENGFQIV